ncbi:hypothetical protein DL766_006168 [Monosporascus sp. MC13-8B]|uniref:Uncharacterized protein n=1 Tax=Monosporascus cannonballus TaxID=155416 RepID=A0ABY0HEG6_9PEZI|nr:hypothetical protein DL762_002562 [Monosporascus cannonballus]RYO95207.1 hypothetical protein DL763_003775 [Monosporascus cannonballus]RYP27861.1 hypothetical protein DL766_006168 [Monosporascus sp. MC13-8B]
MPSLFSSRSKRDLHRTETLDSTVTTFTMSTVSASTNDSRPTSRNYDTGFPDWFAAHTTSLRHPDAIVGSGACISAEDFDPDKAIRRSKRRLLAKHRRTLSHGKIEPEAGQGQDLHLSAIPDNDSVLDEDTHEEELLVDEVINWNGGSSPDSSGDGEERPDSRRESRNPFKRIFNKT